MRHAVIIHYPECDTEDEVAVFTTTATRAELLNALECANEASREKRFYDRFDRAYWVCEEVAKAVDGRCEFAADDYITIDIEEPEG